MNTLFAPARRLFSVIGFGARFHLLAGLIVLLSMLVAVDDTKLRLTLVGIIASIAVYLVFAIMRSIVEGRQRLQDELGRIGSGHLSISSEVQIANVERDAVNLAVGRTRESLAKIVLQVRGTSDVIVRSTRELGTGNQRLADRTEHQAATLQEAAAGMEELSATVAQNASNVAAASARASDVRSIAQSGARDVSELIRTVSRIEESSKRVTDIIGVIEGIAFQTNILALNAAIEAARAGDQGRGFAVVAKEVRNLAQRSSEAVTETRALIAGVAEHVGLGSSLATRAEGSISKVTQGIEEVAKLTNEVSQASAQQCDSVEQMKQASFHLDRQDAREQAMALVRKAVFHIQSNRREDALRDVSDPAGEFVDGEFYIAVNDLKGICVAHGTMRELIGQSHFDLKDADGKYFVREYLRISAAQGRGWLDYRWVNPATGTLQEKSGYVERAGDLVVSCGIYKAAQADVVLALSHNPRG